MIDKIKVLNIDTNTELSMDKSSGPYILETDGINWGEVPVEHNSYNNLTGVGEIITSSKLQTRVVSITGRVSPTHTNKELAELYNISSVEEINKKKLKEIEQAKKELSQVINPLQYIKLLVGDYYIQGKPNSSVTFANLWKDNNEIYCKFTFSIDCSDPMFHYLSTFNTQLTGLSSGFHFPLIIPKPNGMKYGIRKIYQLVNVNNDSDISLGGIIYMKAVGTVVSPSMTNVYTQEKILINKTMSEGELIKIDTINRKIVGATDGETFESYFQYWVFTNTWLQFDVGNILFGLSAESETNKNLQVWVELNKSFYSMEDQ